MTTPNKLSLKKKQRRAAFIPHSDCIVITDSEDDKENDDKVGVAGSFRTKYRTPRRDSTIPAGNLSLLDQSHASQAEQLDNVTIRRSGKEDKRGGRRHNTLDQDKQGHATLQDTSARPRLSCATNMTQDMSRQIGEHFVSPKSQAAGEPTSLLTEDESDFYSCQGSPPNPMNKVLQDTWMTDISTKSRLDSRPVGKVPPTIRVPSPAQLQTPQAGVFKKPQGSTVRAAAFFSVEKRRTIVPSGAVLAGGSDSDDSPEKRVQPVKLNFTDKIGNVVVPSDEDLTEDEEVAVVSGDVARHRLLSDSDDDIPLVQLGKDFLTDTQFGKIVDWVQNSPFRTVSPGTGGSPDSRTVSDREVDSLLRSDSDEEEAGDTVRPSWAAPLPDLSVNTSNSRRDNERTSKVGGSWNQSNSERTSKAEGSWKPCNSEVTSETGGSSFQSNADGTSKAGGSWNHSCSNRTSKAGGSWNQGNSERISKAESSWNHSCSERTSKGGGSWNNTPIERTSKAGENVSNNNSQRTSKAGGSWLNAGTERTSKSGSDSLNQSNSKIERKIKSGGTQVPTLCDSDFTSNLGAGNDEHLDSQEIDLDGTLEDFDKMKLSGAGGPKKVDSSVQGKSSLNGSRVNKHPNINKKDSSRTSKKDLSTKSSNNVSTKTSNTSTKSSGVPSSTKQSKTATSSFHLHLSSSQADLTSQSLDNIALNLDGALTNSHSCSNPPDRSILQSSYVKAPPSTAKPIIPPIENSVNAVRCWTQELSQPKPDSDDVRDVWGQFSVRSEEPASQMSEGVEKCNDKGKCASDSEDDLEKFLTNLKSKKKSKLVSSSDSDNNFVVPDQDVDSDQFNTPRMSLKDRIMKKTKPDISSHRKPRVPSPLSDSDSDSLPDIDRKENSSPETPDEGARVIKPRPGRSVKKAHVIYSDSEDDQAGPVHEISSDNDDEPFVNIYEPGSYHLVPPPSTPIVIPPTEKKSKPRSKKLKEPKSTLKTSQVVEDSNFSTPGKTLTFLSSLTMDTPLARCHPSALPYLSNFPKHRVELASRLYQLYNTQIFSSALPEDMEITWNVRLTKTAGLCYSRRHRNRHNIEVRSSRIELSTKVIDCGDRLRDTLIHEMCHAASWIISGYRDGHGPLWRTWAEKAMERFPELPVIDRCHSYQIRTKYTYRCEKCGYSIGRHSKSLDTEKKVCGHCYGKFQLVVNGKSVQAKTAPGMTPSKPKAPNAFALFVKENYKIYKQPGVSHGEVMKTLSTKFSAAKINK